MKQLVEPTKKLKGTVITKNVNFIER